jgi:hypothetical protein
MASVLKEEVGEISEKRTQIMLVLFVRVFIMDNGWSTDCLPLLLPERVPARFRRRSAPALSASGAFFYVF